MVDIGIIQRRNQLTHPKIWICSAGPFVKLGNGKCYQVRGHVHAEVVVVPNIARHILAEIKYHHKDLIHKNALWKIYNKDA